MIRTKTTKRWIRERTVRFGRAIMQAFEKHAQMMVDSELPGLPRQ